MNTKLRFILVLSVAGLLTGLLLIQSPAIQTSAASWTITCSGVTSSQRGLWLDAASGEANNEAGFFWLQNNDAGTETCHATAYLSPLVSTNAYPKLKVRAAVNDGAVFQVQVFERAISDFCTDNMKRVATLSWGASQDTSGYVVKEIDLPADKDICAVRIVLSDDPDSTDTWRTNALIDYIRISNGTTNGWTDRFTGGNP